MNLVRKNRIAFRAAVTKDVHAYTVDTGTLARIVKRGLGYNGIKTTCSMD